ncbi:hypothetical protein [Streptomyces sp. NPDC088157]|uniref:hypothetical protein n=1 Tax=Streptomyces sp. NPDC088157 TaxID=3365832 RepID=UPI003809778C
MGNVPTGPGVAGGPSVVRGTGAVGDGEAAEAAYGGVVGLGRPEGSFVGAPRPTRRGGTAAPDAARWTLVADVIAGVAELAAAAGKLGAVLDGSAGPVCVGTEPLAPPTGRTGPLEAARAGGVTGTWVVAARCTSVDGVRAPAGVTGTGGAIRGGAGVEVGVDAGAEPGVEPGPGAEAGGVAARCTGRAEVPPPSPEGGVGPGAEAADGAVAARCTGRAEARPPSP